MLKINRFQVSQIVLFFLFDSSDFNGHIPFFLADIMKAQIFQLLVI